MKVLKYLQRVGAVPRATKEDLLMSLVSIINDFFTPITTVKPETIPWVKEASSNKEEYQRRYDLLLLCTSGDIRAAFPAISQEDESSLQTLIEELLKVRMYIYALGKGQKVVPDTDEFFIECFNEMLGLEEGNCFVSKPQLMSFYYSDKMNPAGKAIIENELSSIDDIRMEVLESISNFVDSTPDGYKVDLAESFSLEVSDVELLHGGAAARITLLHEDSQTRKVCTLHWAPWPSAKTSSKDPVVVEMCESFTNRSKEKWLQTLKEMG